MSKKLHDILTKAMHNEPETRENAIPDTHFDAYTRYSAWWPLPDGAIGPEADAARKKRQANANQITIAYYDLVSPAYEQGWGQQFHFGPFTPQLSIRESLIEYEKLAGNLIGLKEGMRVLDVGCGIAGPARTMAKNFGVRVVGVTNSPWHVQRGRELNELAGLGELVEMVEGDFHHLPFEDDSFDAAYAFEAIGYSPTPTIVYAEIRRVLKPDAIFALHEWVMKESYDPNNKRHRILHDGIEHGMGLTKLPTIFEIREGLKQCGFVTSHEEPMEDRSKPGPWYFPLLGMTRYTTCKEDFWKTIVMERKVVVPLFGALYWLLVKLRVIPKEVLGGFHVLRLGTESVALGGKIGIFSPSTMFISRNFK